MQTPPRPLESQQSPTPPSTPPLVVTPGRSFGHNLTNTSRLKEPSPNHQRLVPQQVKDEGPGRPHPDVDHVSRLLPPLAPRTTTGPPHDTPHQLSTPPQSIGSTPTRNSDAPCSSRSSKRRSRSPLSPAVGTPLHYGDNAHTREEDDEAPCRCSYRADWHTADAFAAIPAVKCAESSLRLSRVTVLWNARSCGVHLPEVNMVAAVDMVDTLQSSSGGGSPEEFIRSMQDLPLDGSPQHHQTED
jgi:hypothetical protein